MGAHRKRFAQAGIWFILMVLVTGCEHYYKPSPETVGELADPLRALMAVQESLGKTTAAHDNCPFITTGRGIDRTCDKNSKGYRRYQDTPIPEIEVTHGDARIGLKPYMWLYRQRSPPGSLTTPGLAADTAVAKQFANGWYVLAQPRTLHDPATDATFLDAVKRYRAEPQTHAETLRRVQVQVESAIKEHRVPEAAMLYRDTLKNAAGWPEGHFNLALLYGELEFFVDAVNEMKRYFYLMPNAPDARAAQDKVYEWELKAKR